MGWQVKVLGVSRQPKSMKSATKFQVVFAVIVMAAGLVITAIDNYTEAHALDALSIFPYFLGAMLGGTVHNPSATGYILGLVLEWGIFGYLLARLVSIFVENKKRDESQQQNDKP